MILTVRRIIDMLIIKINLKWQQNLKKSVKKMCSVSFDVNMKSAESLFAS